MEAYNKSNIQIKPLRTSHASKIHPIQINLLTKIKFVRTKSIQFLLEECKHKNEKSKGMYNFLWQQIKSEDSIY